MKTDPENTDYTMEHGASRNYEPWREKAKQTNTALADREEEERGNAMKQLENRTLDSKREMDIMAALDEMQSLNARHARVNTDAALAALKRSAMEDEAAGQIDLHEEDEAVLRQMLEQQSKHVRRIGQDDAIAASHTTAAVMGNLPLSSASAGTERDTSARLQSTSSGEAAASKATAQATAAGQTVKPKALPIGTVKAKAPQVMVKAKRKADVAEQLDLPPDKKQTHDGSISKPTKPGGLAGLAAYGSDSDKSNSSDV
ncbi:hypothetical protein ABBQ38_013049 [Trebouxia sp. C0009 RCD-2024]